METLESYRGAVNSFWKPWIDSFESLTDIYSKAMNNDSQAYIDFLEPFGLQHYGRQHIFLIHF